MCFLGLKPIPIIPDQVVKIIVYMSGVKIQINVKIKNNKGSDQNII